MKWLSTLSYLAQNKNTIKPQLMLGFLTAKNSSWQKNKYNYKTPAFITLNVENKK